MLLSDSMGNVIGSIASGFASVLRKIFGSPMDFLSGKSCSSVCGSTWDFICYIENFCVANLLKMAMVLVLSYIVLLFIYMLYKLGICGCVCWGLFKMLWACLASYFHACKCCCTCIWINLRRLKRTNRHYKSHNIDYELDMISGRKLDNKRYSSRVPRHLETSSSRSLSRHWRSYRSAQLRKSLRPRSHRTRVGFSRDMVRYGGRRRGSDAKHGSHVGAFDHDIRVTRSSRFVHKGPKHRGRVHSVGKRLR